MSTPISTWITACDIGLQVLNRFLLSGHDPVHQIADGNYAGHRLTLNYRKVAHSAVSHEAHAILDAFLGINEQHRVNHNVPHFGFAGVSAHQNNFARIIPLGDDAREPSPKDNGKSSHLL